MGRKAENGDELARRFAWRFVAPTDEVIVDAPVAAVAHPEVVVQVAPSPARAPSDEVTELDVERAEARLECARLALAIDRAWALADVAAQRRATRELARRAAKLGVSLAAMQEHSLEGVRLARLLVRHFKSLGDAARRDASSAALWLDYGHRDAIELVVETVRAGAVDVADAMALAFETEERDEGFAEEITTRLSAELDAAPSDDARLIALRWLAVAGTERAAPSLRRALGARSVAVRARALEILLELERCMLVDADVITLLEEAADGDVPDDDSEHDDRFLYARALMDAIVRVRPDEGADLLREIAEEDTLHPVDLDRSWALETLAAAYPFEALALLEQDLACASTHVRASAVEAAARLPADVARPWLERAASDPSPRVAERARELFAESGLGMLSCDPMAGVPVDLLDAPPSDRFASRVLVLRGRAVDARRAMMRVLLRESPDREALVLLTFALGDDEVWRGASRERLPWDAAGWTRRLVSRFGAPAVRALCALSMRFPRDRGNVGGWLESLAAMVARGAIAKRDAAPVRAAALAKLRAGWSGDLAPLKLLAALEPTPDWRDALWAVLSDSAASPLLRMLARDLLAAWRDADVDARLAAELDGAFAARDWERLGELVGLGGRRGAKQAVAIAERALASIDDRAALDALLACATLLQGATRLPDEFMARALAEPQSLRFTVATRLVRGAATESIRALLVAALSSTARDGAAAAEAAEALLFVKRGLRANDPRIDSILARAPLAARARLLEALLIRKAPFDALRPQIEAVLVQGDEAVAGDLVDSLALSRSRASFLRRLAPRMTDAGLRARVRGWLGDAATATTAGDLQSN